MEKSTKMEVLYIKQEVVPIEYENEYEPAAIDNSPDKIKNEPVHAELCVEIKRENVSDSEEEYSRQQQAQNYTEIVHKIIAKLYSCYKCQLKFSTETELASHYVNCRTEIKPKGSFCCPQCGISYKYEADLKRHIEIVHESINHIDNKSIDRVLPPKTQVKSEQIKPEESVICDICQKEFPSKKRLKNHVFYSHPSPDLQVTYEICQKVFQRSSNLTVHMKLVHPTEDKPSPCLICHKVYKNPMILQKHVKWSHSDDGTKYDCEICNRTFPSVTCVNEHKLNVHSNGNIKCELCEKVFKTPATFRKHKKRMHTSNPSDINEKLGDFPCLKCNQTFTTESELDWHLDRYHLTEGNNTCRICNKQLSVRRSLKRHMRTVHSKTPASFDCNICGKQFKAVCYLQRHLKITHAPPGDAAKCNICQKMFKCSFHLRIHQSTVHVTSGVFPCHLCDKEFPSNKYLKRHIISHEPNRNYSCEVCDKTYRCIGDAKNHMRKVHNIRRSDNNIKESNEASQDGTRSEDTENSVDSIIVKEEEILGS